MSCFGDDTVEGWVSAHPSHSPLWSGRSVRWYRGAELYRLVKITVRWKREQFSGIGKILGLFGWSCRWGLVEVFKRNSVLPFPSEKPDKTICSLTSNFPHDYYDTKLKFSKPQGPGRVFLPLYFHVFDGVFFLLFLMLEQPIQAFPKTFCCSSAVEIAVYPFVIRASDHKTDRHCMLFVLPQSLFTPCSDFPF